MWTRLGKSLKSRIFFSITIFVMVPLFLVMGIIWNKMNREMTARQIEIFEENALYSARLSDGILNDIKNKPLLIYFDEKIMEILKSGADISEEKQKLLNGKVSSFFFSDDEIESVAFYVEQAQLMIYRKRNQSNRFYKVTDENLAQRFFLHSYDPEELRYFITTVRNDETQELQLVLDQNIMDEYNRPLVRMEIVYKESVFDHIFSRPEREEFGGNFILDDKGQFIYEEFGESYPEKISGMLKSAPQGISYASVPGSYETDSYAIIKTRLDKVPYDSVKCISMQKVSEYMIPYQNSLAVIFCVMIVIIAILAFVLSRLVSRPIQRFTQSIMDFRGSGTSTRPDIRSEIREMDELAGEFSAMMGEINQLIEEKSDARYKEKKAYIKMLTVQINPHFLYNALQTLQFMAVKRKAFEITAMLASLGKILRYSLEWEKGEVTLEEELENALEYLNIQKFRFVDDLELEVDMPDQLPECYIPKMILQPLVENCFVHGFKDKDGNHMVRLRIFCRQGDVIIWICDNGKGMEESDIERFNQELSRGENYAASGHTGLLSLNYRLRQKYPQAFVQIVQNQWFCVEIVIPGGYHEDFNY